MGFNGEHLRNFIVGRGQPDVQNRVTLQRPEAQTHTTLPDTSPALHSPILPTALDNGSPSLPTEKTVAAQRVRPRPRATLFSVEPEEEEIASLPVGRIAIESVQAEYTERERLLSLREKVGSLTMEERKVLASDRYAQREEAAYANDVYDKKDLQWTRDIAHRDVIGRYVSLASEVELFTGSEKERRKLIAKQKRMKSTVDKIDELFKRAEKRQLEKKERLVSPLSKDLFKEDASSRMTAIAREQEEAVLDPMPEPEDPMVKPDPISRYLDGDDETPIMPLPAQADIFTEDTHRGTKQTIRSREIHEALFPAYVFFTAALIGLAAETPQAQSVKRAILPEPTITPFSVNEMDEARAQQVMPPVTGDIPAVVAAQVSEELSTQMQKEQNDTISEFTPTIEDQANVEDVTFQDIMAQTVEVQSGDSLYKIVDRLVEASGTNWKTEKGVSKGYVIAAQLAKFAEQDGMDPNRLIAGSMFTFASYGGDRLASLEAAWKSESAQDYGEHAMPLYQKLLRKK